MAWFWTVRHAARHAVEHMRDTEPAKLLDRVSGSILGALATSAALGAVTGWSLAKPSRADADAGTHDQPYRKPYRGKLKHRRRKPAEVPVALPTDKLCCHASAKPPRVPTVLVSCGSFNPPTVAHMRMFELASQALAERGHDVWGCYMSPVNGSYGKQHLAPVSDRLQMCQLAAQEAPGVMVDSWEAVQKGYVRTLSVLQRVQRQLQQLLVASRREAISAAVNSSPELASMSADAGAAPAVSHASASTAGDEGEEAEDDVGAVLSLTFVPGAVPTESDARGHTHHHNHQHHHKQVTITMHHPNPQDDLGAILGVAFVPGAVSSESTAPASASEATPAPPATPASSAQQQEQEQQEQEQAQQEQGQAQQEQAQAQQEQAQAKQAADFHRPQALPQHQHTKQEPPQPASEPSSGPQVMLLCGEDLLESMARPGAWHRPDYILEHYGVVCVARDGGKVQQMLAEPGNLLHSYRENIVMVSDPVPNTISSSKVRGELQAGRPVRYLLPEPVLKYIYQHTLYGSKQGPPQSL